MSGKFPKLVLLGLLFAAALSAGGRAETLPLPKHARYAIEHFGEQFGLGAVTVIALAQDQQGFLWIGTETGLYRYDGSSVKHFGPDEGLPGQLVDLIIVAPDGRLWVRSRKGISRFDHKEFTTLALPAEAGALPEVRQSFAVDCAGRLFISTQHGLLRLDPEGKTFRLYGTAEGLSSDHVDAIVRAPDDTIWFASGIQVGRFLPGSTQPETFSSLKGLADDRVIALLPAPDGKLWFRSGHHLGTLDTKRTMGAPVWLDQGIPAANSMGGPSLDLHGNLLLPTYEGLYRRSGNQWKIVDHKSGLTSSALFSVLEDREGGIWIGTAGAGLDHWPGSQQWSGWTDAEGLPDALVLGVVRDRRSRLWVATNTALALWDPAEDRWRTWTRDGLAGAGVRQILLTPDGAVWALFPAKGLFRFDASLPHPRAERVPVLPGEWQPHRIAAAPDGSIWADGKDMLHIVRYRGRGNFAVREQTVPIEEAGTTRTLSISPSGVVWTGGSNGLSRLANGKWQHFQKDAGLLATNVADVKAAGDDEAWIGYPDEGNITRVQLFSGGALLTQHFRKGMCALGMDARHNVWIEMEQGAGMVSPGGILRTFTQSDGLLWNDINCDTLWQESDGSILIGTSKGLARYDPRQESQKLPQPTVVLTSAVFGRTDRLEEPSAQVEYRDRTFQAQFATPTFRDPDRVSCRYRLRGLEQEFTQTTLREVRYSSLPPGNYALEVRCGSAELGWSGLVSYPFAIRPPWWQTWWAELVGVGLLALPIGGVIQYRTRRDRKEKERLEIAVAQRSAELAKANHELEEASLSDPLTGIRNRRFFQTTIPADASQALRAHRAGTNVYSRDHRDLIFYLIDVDHFKEVNDHYGHDAGDHLLTEIARRLSEVVRESDFLIRWGGRGVPDRMPRCRTEGSPSDGGTHSHHPRFYPLPSRRRTVCSPDLLRRLGSLPLVAAIACGLIGRGGLAPG